MFYQPFYVKTNFHFNFSKWEVCNRPYCVSSMGYLRIDNPEKFHGKTLRIQGQLLSRSINQSIADYFTKIISTIENCFIVKR